MSGPRPVLADLHKELSLAAAEILADREWHSYPAVLRELSHKVPPGVAVRRAEQLRKKQRNDHGSPAPVERVKPRETDALIRTGARDIVKSFLANVLVFEVDKKYPRGPRPAGFVDDRKIRLIGLPRSLRPVNENRRAKLERSTTVVNERDRLRSQNEHLRDQIASLRTLLIGLGYEDRANEIAPPEEDDEGSND